MHIFNSVSFLKTKFIKVSNSVVFGEFRSILIKNCVFMESNQPFKVFKYRNSYFQMNGNQSLKISNAKFLDCASLNESSPGGAIMCIDSNVFIEFTVFDHCTATNVGAAYFEKTTLSLNSVNFTYNLGCQCCGALLLNQAVLIAQSCLFYANRAGESNGCAVFENSSIFMNEISFIQNYAHDSSGAISLFYSHGSLISNEFVENHCNSSASAGAMSIIIGETPIQILTSVFLRNEACFQDSTSIIASKSSSIVFSKCIIDQIEERFIRAIGSNSQSYPLLLQCSHSIASDLKFPDLVNQIPTKSIVVYSDFFSHIQYSFMILFILVLSVLTIIISISLFSC